MRRLNELFNGFIVNLKTNLKFMLVFENLIKMLIRNKIFEIAKLRYFYGTTWEIIEPLN